MFYEEVEPKRLLSIQSLFTQYRLKKQRDLETKISRSAYFDLLSAFDLRFRCMRSVAAAKFIIKKPIEDKAQIERVIQNITALAHEKNITHLAPIAAIFKENIVLAENIQSSYYYRIWQRSQLPGEPRNLQKLIDHAYHELTKLIVIFNLPISYDQEIHSYSSEDVLDLARHIIKHASEKIIEALSNSTHSENTERELFEIIQKMLSNYMTPSALIENTETISLLRYHINDSMMLR